jgi:photosystem II stability/assembly factor-like uncharacterized protein
MIALLWATGAAHAAKPGQAPTITGVDPSSAPNDLDAVLTINGTDFVAVPTVTLGSTSLDEVSWLNNTALTVTIPWGLEPGVYTVTVTNPGGQSGSLPSAFTVTQGIGVWNATELYGGQVNEVAINPQTPKTVYAVSADVGMFRSQDSAETWTFQVAGGDYSVRNLAIDPVSPTVIYMHMPWDLHRSDDEGDTWTPLDAPGDIPFPHPTDSGTLFVSNRWEGQSGLWKSTNYGQTWLTMTTGLTDTRVNNLVFDPTDPMTLYAGTELGNLFVSRDGGVSWSFVDHPLDYIGALAINPRGDHELWASNCCFCNPNTTLRSTNAAHTTWLTVSAPVGSMPLTSIEFAPDAWGAAYSQTLFVSGCWDKVQKSEDNGASWTSLDPQAGRSNPGLGLHPSAPNVLYATGSQQAMYKTTDGGTTWQVAHEGLTAVIPEHLATVAGQPDTLYAVTDIGLLKGTGGGAAWQSLPVGGDVSFVATDPFTPSRVYAVGGGVDIYISGDGGQTWPTTTSLPTPPQYDQYAHLDPVLQPDPSQPGVLLAGIRHARIELGGDEAGSLYRSTDAGLTWAEVDVGQIISPVQDIAFDVISPTVVYLATSGDWSNEGTGLFRSTDGGHTWQRVGTAVADLDDAESIAVEPRPPYRVFVLAHARVYVSEDRGLTWSQTNILHGAIRSLLCSHDLPDSILYIAGGMGLYRSTVGGDSWEPAAGVLGQVPVYSLAEAVTADRTVLYAGTTGGYVTMGTIQALDQPLTESSLVNAGVYRFTTRQGWKVYLPLVQRDL